MKNFISIFFIICLLVCGASAQTVRIAAGSTTNYVDGSGNTWLADTGFTNAYRPSGIVSRGSITITNSGSLNTIYQHEHYGMCDFGYPVSNGNYNVILHFAETYTNSIGSRILGVIINGQKSPSFDVVQESGNLNSAYSFTTSITVTNGYVNIHFIQNFGVPIINGIEIVSTP